MTGSFFRGSSDGTFTPTDFTIGPWSRDAQHGGPPAALLGRALERTAGADKQIARVTFDILKPVPLRPLSIVTTVVRPGKKVALIDAVLRTDDDVVMRASAWALRVDKLDLPERAPDDPPSPPDRYDVMNPSDVVPPTTYLHGTEWRFVSGAFLEPGPAVAWIRTRVPLVGGEEDSPLVKVLAVVDSASGVSGALDFHSWLYINTDLSVYLHRMPRGDWIKVDATTTPEASGNALCSARLYDEHGPIGTSSQALFVAPR